MSVQGHRVPEESEDTNKQTQRVRAEGLRCPSLSPPRMGQRGAGGQRPGSRPSWALRCTTLGQLLLQRSSFSFVKWARRGKRV